MDPQIHQLFSDHYEHCTHRQGKDLNPPSATAPPDKLGSTTSSDQADNTVDDHHQRDTTPTASPAKSKKNAWKTAVHNQRKIKVNHGLAFSEQHKRRMEMNVFDRLMGNKKK